jgi:hypothetical protein
MGQIHLTQAAAQHSAQHSDSRRYRAVRYHAVHSRLSVNAGQ